MSAETKETLHPCPFCGSHDLVENMWSVDLGEEDAIECVACKSGALKREWNHANRIPLFKLRLKRDSLYEELNKTDITSKKREEMKNKIEGFQLAINIFTGEES